MNIKAHYFVENISLHTTHPRDGGVVSYYRKPNGEKDTSKYIECMGYVRCDILESYILDGELHFMKLRIYPVDGSAVRDGWTWADNLQIFFEENKFDGRFNQHHHEKLKVVREESGE